MFDVLGLAALLVLALLMTWLARRARRAGHPAVKWIGLVLAGLLAVVFTLGLCVALVGSYKLNFPPRRQTVATLRVAATPEQVARGARFAVVCAGCHSPNEQPPLIGRDFFAGGGPPAGKLYAPNLTPAGEIKDWSDDEIIRAIREGVHKSGRALIVMPSQIFRNLSDADVHAIVAYLRAQPAVGPATPPTKLNVVAALFLGSTVASTSAQPPITQPVTAPPSGPSAEYGKYLVSVLLCQECHGENLGGRKPGGLGPPAGPNLTLIGPKWTAEEFIHTLRTGVDPYKHTLTAGMPWKVFSTFASDEDLTAIHAYLHGLTPINGSPQ